MCAFLYKTEAVTSATVLADIITISIFIVIAEAITATAGWTWRFFLKSHIDIESWKNCISPKALRFGFYIIQLESRLYHYATCSRCFLTIASKDVATRTRSKTSWYISSSSTLVTRPSATAFAIDCANSPCSFASSPTRLK